jgi:hypothetical protein
MEGHSRKFSNADLANAPAFERKGLAPSNVLSGRKHVVEERIASRKDAGRWSRSGVFFGGSAV